MTQFDLHDLFKPMNLKPGEKLVIPWVATRKCHDHVHHTSCLDHCEEGEDEDGYCYECGFCPRCMTRIATGYEPF